MAGNTLPIFSKIGKISWNTANVNTANTSKDGTAGTIYPIFTSDATNGSRLERIRVKSLGTNVATVLRVFINNGSATSVAGNNILYDELTLPATTINEVVSQFNNEIPIGLSLPPGYTVFVTIGTVVAAGYSVTAIGGDY